MRKSILVTGGARSGKSAYAEILTQGLAEDLGRPPIYIATAEALDDEMRARIAEHQARRGDAWANLEAPLDLVGALNASDGAGPRLVDCLTLWLSNLMHAEQHILEAQAALLAAVARQASPIVFVTNEVGAGIVPENPLARRFRDAAGRLNQAVAAEVDDVYLTVSGIPLRLKSND